MNKAELAIQADIRMGNGIDDLRGSAPAGYLAIVQNVIEDLTALVEEYEGVLDAQD